MVAATELGVRGFGLLELIIMRFGEDDGNLVPFLDIKE
jgi:hypothetical protein